MSTQPIRILLAILVVSFLALAQEAPDANAELLAAAAAGDTIAVTTAIRKGADINGKDAQGQTPLMLATSGGHDKTVKVLLDVGPLIDIKDNQGRTALDIAEAAGYVELVRLLKSKGAIEGGKKEESEPAEPSPPALVSPAPAEAVMQPEPAAQPVTTPRPSLSATNNVTLIQAARAGDADAIARLLQTGADSNATGKNEGLTPLHWAVLRGSTPSVAVLLSAGTADINARTRLKRIGIQWAVQRGYYDILKALLTAGSDPNTTDGNGKTLLMEAASVASDHPLVITALLQAGANPNLADNQGRTALAYAQNNGHQAVIELLEQAAGVTEQPGDLPDNLPAKTPPAN